MSKTNQSKKYADPTTENKKIESGKAENNRTEKNKTGKKEYFGTVCEIQRNSYNILVENKMIHAKLKGNFFKENEELPVVGDNVAFLPNENGDSLITSVCERAFIRELDGGCSSPIAAYAEVIGDTVVLRGLYYEECSGKTVKEKQEAPVSQAEELGIALARRLKQAVNIRPE